MQLKSGSAWSKASCTFFFSFHNPIVGGRKKEKRKPDFVKDCPLRHLMFRLGIKDTQAQSYFSLFIPPSSKAAWELSEVWKVHAYQRTFMTITEKWFFSEIKTKWFFFPHFPPTDNHVWQLPMSKNIFSPERKLVKRVRQFPFVFYLQLWEKNDLWLL